MAQEKVLNSRFKFDTRKPGGEVRKHAKALGFQIDEAEFKLGSDWLWMRRMYPKGNQMPLQVKYNTVNGRFFVWTPEMSFVKDARAYTESSVELEGTDWYDELLLICYRPHVEKGDRVTVSSRGLEVTGLVVSAEWYEETGWYIEMTGANVPGGYSYWKQRDDGGFLIGLTPAALITSEA